MNTNKDIKFRAWNTNFLKMFTSFYLTSKGEVLVENSDSKTSSNEQVEGIIQGRPSTPKDFILMQYTGLKDKNGKEVYEGDIVKFSYEPNKLCVVKWVDSLCTVCSAVTDSGGEYERYFFIKSDSDKYEVVGNIYENKHLLDISY